MREAAKATAQRVVRTVQGDDPSLPSPSSVGKAFRESMAGGGESNIMVTVRVRPLLDLDQKKESVVSVLDGKVIIVTDPGHTGAAGTTNYLGSGRTKDKRYAFDRVFSEGESQQCVYNNTARYLVPSVLDGNNQRPRVYTFDLQHRQKSDTF